MVLRVSRQSLFLSHMVRTGYLVLETVDIILLVGDALLNLVVVAGGLDVLQSRHPLLAESAVDSAKVFLID